MAVRDYTWLFQLLTHKIRTCKWILQAQDRAHRIEQTKPVPIFRLVSRHTIENKILQRASEKRQLEALVIAKGALIIFPPHHHSDS